MRLVILFFLLQLNFALCAQEKNVHPRGIITRSEIASIRKKIQKEPYKSWFNKIESTCIQAEKSVDKKDPYETSYLAQKQAQLYILTGEKKWAEKCFQTLQVVINDSVYFNDPVSRGLTRATQLFNVAICYDFCFDAWNEKQRELVNSKLFQTMLNTNSNMGFSANYALESNWNGVRWGSVLMAALVYDNPDKKYEKNPALPFIWDTQRRLQEHISKNIFPGGWSAESLSYHVYNWSFIGPSLIALQNNYPIPAFELENFAPHAINSLWGWSTSTVSIKHPDGKGIQPDLSDDDPQSSYLLTTLGLKLYPEKQIPAIKWIHNYLLDLEQITDNRAYLFYSICWYPENIKAENPENIGWLDFTDSTYGVSVWRNRFKDENDMVVAFTAPVKRVKGHQGPDNLTFRIIGLGNIWVTGTGRTGEIAGQTNLFTSPPKEKEKSPKGSESSKNYSSGKRNNEFYASAEGSCMGVENHKRKIEVDFIEDELANILIHDTSSNGKIWRLNTPEFNEVEIVKNGFILTAPNGSKMSVTAPLDQIKGEITISKIKYGGTTAQHNNGIGYGENYWAFNKAIDIPCDGDIEIRIQLFESK